MKGAWVRPGGPKYPDPLKAKKYGVTRHYWDATDPQIDSVFLDQMRTRTEVGFTRDPRWGDLSAVDLARTMDADLVRLGSANKQCAVIADIESHDAVYVVAWLKEWRKLRPARVTGWTMEPNQFDTGPGGWVTPALVTTVNADPNLMVFPQLYLGDMTPAVESLVATEVVAAGVRRDRVRCYYGPKAMPAAWDGIVFGLAELP